MSRVSVLLQNHFALHPRSPKVCSHAEQSCCRGNDRQRFAVSDCAELSTVPKAEWNAGMPQHQSPCDMRARVSVVAACNLCPC